jgi:hypothetical protein
MVEPSAAAPLIMEVSQRFQTPRSLSRRTPTPTTIII